MWLLYFAMSIREGSSLNSIYKKRQSHYLYGRIMDTQSPYAQRINRAMNYISSHLADNSNLEDVAAEVGISKYHFHRIFKAFVGESAGAFFRRVQLERSAILLIYHKEKPIKDIAYETGFSSSQNFAKLFKKKFGRTPNQYRQTQPAFVADKNSNIGNIDTDGTLYYCISENQLKTDTDEWKRLYGQIAIRTVTPQTVLYERHYGAYTYSELSKLYGRLFDKIKGLSEPVPFTTVMGIVWDYVAITDDSKCRYDACVALPKGYRIPAGAHTQVLEGGKFAVYSCTVENFNFYHHWNVFLTQWLPQSGYELDNRPSLEVFTNLSSAMEKGTFSMEIWMPVQ